MPASLEEPVMIDNESPKDLWCAGPPPTLGGVPLDVPPDAVNCDAGAGTGKSSTSTPCGYGILVLLPIESYGSSKAYAGGALVGGGGASCPGTTPPPVAGVIAREGAETGVPR